MKTNSWEKINKIVKIFKFKTGVNDVFSNTFFDLGLLVTYK